MDNPPRAPKPANATIQIDRLDLDEILLVDTSDQNAAVPHSVPPPLPPEEIAKAASLAPAAASLPAPAAEPSRTLLIAGILAAVVVVAVAAGIFFGKAVRPSQPVAPATSVAAAANPAAQPSAAPTAATITIHTVELGGATTNADE